MALGHEIEYVSLYNIRLAITLDGESALSMLDLTELQIPRDFVFAERKPGSSKVMVKVPKHHDLVMKAKFFNGDEISYKDIKPGGRIDACTILTTEESPVSIVQDDFFTLFPVSGWMIGPAGATIGDDPSESEFEIHTNVRGDL